MFSQRTAHVSALNPLSAAVEARRAAGLPVLDLTATNPSSVGLRLPPHVLDALSSERGAVYAPDPLGLLGAREALAAHLRSLGECADPARMVLSASSSEAYAWLFKLLCNPGDDVLVPTPSYPLFEHLAQLEGVTLRPYPLAFDGQWHLDFHTLRGAVSSRTRALILVSPNNPTGQYLRAHERAQLCQLGLPLVADEVFFHHPLDRPADAVHAAGGGVLTFTLGGLSKLCMAPQLKLGWTLVDGPADHVAEAMRRLELIADTFLSVNTPVQEALPQILQAGAELRAQVNARTRENLDHLRSAAQNTPITVLRAEAGWCAVVRFPHTRSDEQWALDALHAHGVVTHPGYFFDLTLPACLVLSLLTPPTAFRRGVGALVALASETD